MMSNGQTLDVSVLLIFFTRDALFRRVFEVVRECRPKRLFLFQDGPRADHPEDIEGIKRCREIAEGVDWDCEVHKNYNEVNLGPDEAGFKADTWAFSLTDKCVVLEDDVLPSKTFLPFCKEMLDRYEDDPRVMLISCFNPMEKTEEINTDILFTSASYTLGWASWKRVVDSWDPQYSWLDNEDSVSRVRDYIKQHKVMKNFINMAADHRSSGIPHFETVLIANQYLKGGLTLTPRVNMVSHIGVDAGASHYPEDPALLPKAIRKLFSMGIYDLDIENLRLPKEVSEYRPYREKTYRIYGWGHPLIKFWRFLEGSFYEIRAGNIDYVIKDFMDKVRNVTHRLNT